MTKADRECHYCGAPCDWTRPDCRFCNTVRPPELPKPERTYAHITDFELRKALELYRRTA